MKNKFLYLTIFSLGLLATSCGGGNEDASNEESDKDSIVENVFPIVSAEPIEIKDFVHKVEVQGGVESDKDALINAEASGTIRVIHVKEGQKVSKGQALITIDSQILQSSIEEVENSFELATYMFDKQQKLMDEGVGVEFDYETAKNNKIALEKKLKTMKTQSGKSVVRAPFSGIVDNIMVNIGEMAAPQFPLLRLVNNNEVSIKASVSENYLMNIKKGTAVELEIPSLNDTIIPSVVSYVGNYIDPVNRTFNIRIDLKNNKLLIPNQLAKVNVTDYYQADATIVSNEAILQDTENNNYIYVLTDKDKETWGVQKIYVEILSQYKGETSIKATGDVELKEGQKVVLRGAKGITEKDRVKLQ